MDIKISLIMPVYNVEKYLRKSIESILNQTFKYFELIIVNDGSTDGSKEICEEYAKIDNRIKLINIKNSGLANARNKGIRIAKGNYIGFIDSDDFIESNMYEKLYDDCINNNSDISIIGVKHVDENNKCLDQYIPGKADLIEIMKKAYAWNKLYKRRLFIDNKLYFASKKHYEDVELIPKLFVKANKVTCVKIAAYNYLKREGSITQKRDEKILDNLWAYTSVKKYLINENLYDIYNEEFKQCVKNFKKYYCKILYDYPTIFLLKNSIRIISLFEEIEKLKINEYIVFLKMHLIFKIKRIGYDIKNLIGKGR